MDSNLTYYTIKPSPLLAGYVRFFWVLQMDRPCATPYIYRSLADGCAELVFHYKGVFDELVPGAGIKQSLSLVHGPSRIYRRFITKTNFGIFGVYLYPYALPALFNMPSSSISNQMPDLATLAGKAGKELEEKILLADDDAMRVTIISEFLQKQLAKGRLPQTPVQEAIRHVIHSSSQVAVGDLADRFCLSNRQFERNFKAYAGFSPKTYTRIIRFQTALKDYGLKGKSMTDIAYDCGYYDQSHFINDFKEFSGYNPKEYFSGKAEGVEYRNV